jgi:hypothetical protein
LTTESDKGQPRSYGCTFGCGNPYDYILFDVQAGDTLFLCIPCFIKQAADMVTAFVDPDDASIRVAVTEAAMANGSITPGPSGRKRGHNAPAGDDDSGLFEEYDTVITVDELPPEFR